MDNNFNGYGDDSYGSGLDLNKIFPFEQSNSSYYLFGHEQSIISLEEYEGDDYSYTIKNEQKEKDTENHQYQMNVEKNENNERSIGGKIFDIKKNRRRRKNQFKSDLSEFRNIAKHEIYTFEDLKSAFLPYLDFVNTVRKRCCFKESTQLYYVVNSLRIENKSYNNTEKRLKYLNFILSKDSETKYGLNRYKYISSEAGLEILKLLRETILILDKAKADQEIIQNYISEFRDMVEYYAKICINPGMLELKVTNKDFIKSIFRMIRLFLGEGILSKNEINNKLFVLRDSNEKKIFEELKSKLVEKFENLKAISENEKKLSGKKRNLLRARFNSENSEMILSKPKWSQSDFLAEKKYIGSVPGDGNCFLYSVLCQIPEEKFNQIEDFVVKYDKFYSKFVNKLIYEDEPCAKFDMEFKSFTEAVSSCRNEDVNFEIVRRARILRAAIAIKYIQNKLCGYIENDNILSIRLNKAETRELLTVLGKNVSNGNESTKGFISAEFGIVEAVADILKMDVLIGIQNQNAAGTGYIFAAPRSKTEKDKGNSTLTYGDFKVSMMNDNEIESVGTSFKEMVKNNNNGNSIIVLLSRNHYVPLGLDSNGEAYSCKYDYYKPPEAQEVRMALDTNEELDKLDLVCENLNFNLKQQQNNEKNFVSKQSDAKTIVDLLIGKGLLDKRLRKEVVACMDSYFKNKNKDKNSICSENQKEQSLRGKIENAKKRYNATNTRSTDQTLIEKNLNQNEVE